MFPISDSPNPRGIPWITCALMALNIVVFAFYLPQMSRPIDPDDPSLAAYLEVLQREAGVTDIELPTVARQVSQYDLVVFEHGYRPAQMSFVDMFTSMFLHGGWMHLIGNMLFLWIYGNNAEYRLGRWLFLIAYLGTGVAAVFGDAMLRPDSGIPAVGASGAISGVLGMYFVWFPHNRVRLLVILPPVFIRTFELGARLVLGFYIVANNLLPVIIGAGGAGGVAYGAHIGGFVAGVAVALLTVVAGRKGAGSKDALDVKKSGLPPKELGEARNAMANYRRTLAERPAAVEAVGANLGAARILSGPLNQPTVAYQHLYRVLEGKPSEGQRREAEALMRELKTRVRVVPNRFVGLSPDL